MELSPEWVRKVAEQARLALTDDEVECIVAGLRDVLAGAERLRELDLTGVEPAIHGVQLLNIMRGDVVEPSMPRDEILAAAPEVQDGMVKVPRLIEEE